MYKAVAAMPLTVPPPWQLRTVVLGTLVAVAFLTAIPSRAGARLSPAGFLGTGT